ncbi:MAG: hypothetical protein PHQ28_00140 [Mycobacterium sp.]|nr:hypothetical protein [Mycobacterium sp.]
MLVEWDEWSPTSGMFICPPPREERCSHCGRTGAPLINLGRVWTDPTGAPPALGIARLRAGGQLVATISAFRCVTCRHDYVLDGKGQAWDLDQTDYTDAGSRVVGGPAEKD